MPGPFSGEHPTVTFARELEALIERFRPSLSPAEIGLVLATNVPAAMLPYCEKTAAAAMSLYFTGEARKRMAKAVLGDS